MGSRSIKEGLHYRALVDGGMLYDAECGLVHHLNATAAFVWEGCQAGEGMEVLEGHFARQFSVDAAVARSDIERLIADFVENGLLT